MRAEISANLSLLNVHYKLGEHFCIKEICFLITAGVCVKLQVLT